MEPSYICNVHRIHYMPVYQRSMGLSISQA